MQMMNVNRGNQNCESILSAELDLGIEIGQAPSEKKKENWGEVKWRGEEKARQMVEKSSLTRKKGKKEKKPTQLPFLFSAFF